MKLFQFYKENQIKLGLCLEEGFLDVEEMVKADKGALPVTMDEVINYKGSLEQLKEQYKLLQPVQIKGEISYAPAVPAHEKILCVGLNYQAHIQETGLAKTENFPPIFPKFGNSLTGHKQQIHLPKEAVKFDYEAELVIIIGKEAKNVSKEKALEYVFGYSVGNDFSARDLQTKTSQWTLGKACDDFAPLGPYVVTAEEIDPNNLRIFCKVNGEIVQDSNTSHMIFSCAEIVSYISKYMTLKPGDIIYTGTPAGVILGKKEEQQNWLKAGDEVCVGIEDIGTLINYLV